MFLKILVLGLALSLCGRSQPAWAAGVTSEHLATPTQAAVGPVAAQHAEPEAEPELPDWAKPPEANHVRALLEWETVFVLGFLWYLTAPGLDHSWNSNYSWKTFRHKLTLDSLEVDRNVFATNFVGHPIGGTAYYLSARSNHMGMSESFAFTVGGSLLWEFFGEAGEVVSLNDSIVTPMAGFAIGESLTQLSDHLERRATGLSRIMANVVNPWKALNNWLDGDDHQPLARNTVPNSEWSRIDLDGALQFTQEHPATGPSQFAEGQVRFASEVQRRPPKAVGRPGLFWFGSANLSRVELESSVGSAGVSDLWINTQIMFAGFEWSATGRRPQLAIGLGSGFEYGLHDYDRATASNKDHLSAVQPIALVASHRAEHGDWSLDSYVHLAPSYGGVDSLALPAYEGPTDELQTVAREQGYYLALGGRGRAQLRLRYQGWEAAGEMRADSLSVTGSPKEPSGIEQSDTRVLFKGGLDYRPRGSALKVGFYAIHRKRSGRLENVKVERQEQSYGVAVGFRL